MSHNNPPQPLQRKGTSAWGRTTGRRLAPICRDALTRHWKGRPPRRVWQLMRLIVFERDGWVCVYCGLRSGPLTCDHVVPVSRGGSSTFDNLVTACLACNLAKSTMTPREWRAQQRQSKRGA
jgi:5-methylcytosine-specific restriction endonuclease McrA